MPRDNNILLSRSEWDAFERKLNTYDADREERAEAFLHGFDALVTVRERGNGVEIDIPWLEDKELLSLFGIEEKKHSKEVVSTMQFRDSFESVPTKGIFNSTKGHPSSHGGVELYVQMVSSVCSPSYSNLPDVDECPKCA